MAQTACEIPIADSEAPRPPGFLLTPFGWATARVTAVLQREPALLADVIHISHTRMHLIALAIAHLDDATPQGIGETLFRGSAGEILDAVVGRRPVGLKRAVRSLPDRVLQAESYRRLLVLLGDPKAAKLLHHSAEIDDATIKMTDDIPPPLRSLVFSMQPWFRGVERLADGLRFLVRSGAAESFEALVADLAAVQQPEQLIARLSATVEALPLPDFVPPAKVGAARRLDCAAEIRSLAKGWQNCLENYLWRIDGGECAVYLWEDADTKAACLVRRRGRLGWFLEEMKGPGNAEIEPPHVDAIQRSFDASGMAHYAIIKAVEDIVDMASLRGLRRRWRRRPTPRRNWEPDETLLQDVA